MEESTKKIIALFLTCSALLFLMTGCSGSQKPDTEEPQTLVDSSQWPKVEAYIGSPILEADPDRDIYISLANQDCDFYPSLPYTGVTFSIISRTEYSSEEINVFFPGKTSCKVAVRNHNDYFQDIALNRETGSYGPDGQQPYHYLCLQNVDLQELAQKRSNASYASSTYYALVERDQASDAAYAALIDTHVTPYQNLYKEYIAQYTEQPVEKLAEYNVYLVSLTFEQKRYVDETVEYIDVTIGDNTYRVEFGQWRFHKEDWPERGQDPKGITVTVSGIVGVSQDSPYAQGYLRTPNAFRFSTKEDIFLTGLRCTDGTDAEILGAQIACTSADNSINYFWDGSGPVKVDKGSNVIAAVYLYSEKFKEYEMNMTTTIYVDYVLASTGEKGSFAMPCNFPRVNSEWDTCCLAFLGIDVGEYYHYFRSEMVKVGWIDEIPEGWRKE